MKEFYNKHKEIIMEILRFLLVGLLATGVDYAAYSLGNYVLFKKLSNFWCTNLSIALGFLLGNIVNYVLSIVFVFKGAKDDKKAKSATSFLIFTVIGILGLFIKMGIQNGGNYIFLKLLFKNLKKGDFGYWFWDTFVYCVATLVVLIWNYIGRKLFIFKNPKNTETEQLDKE